MVAAGYAVFKSARIQTFLAQKAAYVLSESLNTRVSIDGVDFEFLNKLVLEGVYIEDQQKDTLLYVGKLKCLIGGFDSRKNYLQLNGIVLDNAYINIKKYRKGGDFNFQFIVDAFSGGQRDTTVKKKGMEIRCSNFALRNTSVNYSLLYKKHGEWGMDYDYLSVRELNSDFRNLHISGDTIFTDMRNLSFKEKSGFALSYGSADVAAHNKFMVLNRLNLKTNESDVRANIHFITNSFDDYADDFITKVKMNALIYSSSVQMADIAYFAPELKGMNKMVKVDGLAQGTIDDFTIKSLHIGFGKKTAIYGRLKMTGLPDIEETIIDFKIKDLITNKEDIEGIPLPPFDTPNNFIELPSNLNYLGDITYRGDYTGFYNNFVTYGVFTTALGKAKTDIKINYNLETEVTSYSGKLITDNFNLGKLTEEKSLGHISLDAAISGSGFTKSTVNTTLNGNISKLEYNNYTYTNIIVNGDFERKIFKGVCKINDPNIALTFNGDINYKGEIPAIDFVATIDKLNPSALNLYTNKNFNTLSGGIALKMKGNNIDDILGDLSISALTFEKGQVKYNLGDILLNISQSDLNRKIILQSNIADARIIGNFKLLPFVTSVEHLINTYLPSLFNEKKIIEDKTLEDFEFIVQLKNTKDITELFLRDIKFSDGSLLTGEYHSQYNKFDLNFSSPALSISGVEFTNPDMTIKAGFDKLSIKTEADKIKFSDSVYVDQVLLYSYTNSQPNRALFELEWTNKSVAKNSGLFKGYFDIVSSSNFRAGFTEANLVIHDSLWTLSDQNQFDIDTTSMQVKDFVLTHDKQKLEVNGKISSSAADVLNINLSSFNLASFNPVLENFDINLKGLANGSINLSGLLAKSVYTAQLNLDEFAINGEELGKGNITSAWNPEIEGVKASGSFYRGTMPSINFDGYYYPNREKENLDFTVNLRKTQLQLLRQYVEGILSDFKGFASGDIKISGTSKKPVLYGELDIERAGFKVDYLNTNYYFSHQLTLTENLIELSDVTLFDEKGNTANTTFKMYHNFFKDFRFDISVNADNFFVLNTTLKDNNMFYGKAYTTGLISIFGPSDNITMNIAAKTNKGTTLFIPLDQAVEVTENDFISFVKKDTTQVKQVIKKLDLSGIQMNFDLEVTPDAQFQMVFDSKVGDVIKGRGTGNIKMEINTIGIFNMYGNFTFTEGDYLFTFENVINKRFRVEPGSSIAWNGNPYNANINITALYKLKTSLKNLVQDTTKSEYNRSIPVNVKLKMTEKLFNPAINFGIDFPTMQSNESLKADVNAVIGNDNVQELNRQVFALLMIGTFLPPASNASATAARIGEGFGNTSTELLSSQLNNWLSQISKSFNLGVNYKAQTENTAQQVEVAVSTQLFDNRLSIDGNFGVASKQQSTASSNLIDVNVEYKLTPDGKLRVMAYNRPNDYVNAIVTQSPSKQGVGLLYKEEFNNFRELAQRYKNIFKKKKSDKKKKQEEFLKLKNENDTLQTPN